jgi:TrmH family RNA methyltransferase
MRRDTSRHPPWLRDVFDLRARKGKGEGDRLLLEGLRANRAAHRAGLPFEQLLYTPEFFSDQSCRDLLVCLERQGVPARRLPPRMFSRLSYKAEGLVGVVRFALPDLELVLGSDRLIVLDSPSDPGNVGAVLRTANAWGATVIVADGERKLFHPKALRASMGAHFHTLISAADGASLAARVARLGRAVAVLTPDGDARPDALPFHDHPVLVFGNEKRGVHARWLELATLRVAIPMCGEVDSLNMATAAAIILWEAFRRAGRGASMRSTLRPNPSIDSWRRTQ